MKRLWKRLVNDQGFTLIELLAVVAILAILAGIGVPKVWATIQNAKIEAAYSNMMLAKSAVERLLLDLEVKGQTLPSDFDASSLEEYVELPEYIDVSDSKNKITISYIGDLNDDRLDKITIDVPLHLQPTT